MKHTPGPWEVTPYKKDEYRITGNNEQICKMLYTQTRGLVVTHEHLQANARLIAAAPEMKQLLREALADLEGIMPEFEPSGDRTHPAWTTIKEIKQLFKSIGEKL